MAKSSVVADSMKINRVKGGTNAAFNVLFALLAAVPGYFLAVRLVKRYRAARERRRQKKAAEKKL